MSEARINTENIYYNEPCFPFRFPRNGTGERRRAWERSYQNWWTCNYGSVIDFPENGWLKDAKKAKKFLSSSSFCPSRTMWVAVVDPNEEISRLAVQNRKLCIEDFAAALAHPKISVFDLFDAEIADPEGEQKYRDDQIRLGMTVDEAADALILARDIVKKRQVFEIH